MAKISVHGGASDKTLPPSVGSGIEREHPGTGEVSEGVEVPADGTEHELVVSEPGPELGALPAAQGMDAPQDFDELVEPAPPVTPYDAMLRFELQETLSQRGLAKTGTNKELVTRLVESDKAAEDG